MAIGCLSTAGPPGSSFLAASAANTGDVATPDDARIEDTPCAWGCMMENPVLHLLSGIRPGMAASVQERQHPALCSPVGTGAGLAFPPCIIGSSGVTPQVRMSATLI